MTQQADHLAEFARYNNSREDELEMAKAEIIDLNNRINELEDCLKMIYTMRGEDKWIAEKFCEVFK